MNVNMTQQEYRLLLDLLLAADWMIHANRADDAPEAEPYRMLTQKFLSLAPEFGLEELVEIDPEHNQYRPTEKLEKTTTAWQMLDEYDDAVFWEELIVRLAERDVANTPGKAEVTQMSPEEYDRYAVPLEEKYANEFFENGLERLVIRNS